VHGDSSDRSYPSIEHLTVSPIVTKTSLAFLNILVMNSARQPNSSVLFMSHLRNIDQFLGSGASSCTHSLIPDPLACLVDVFRLFVWYTSKTKCSER